MSFEVIRESAVFVDGSFTTNFTTQRITPNNNINPRDGGRYRWIGEGSEYDNNYGNRYRYISEGEETNLKTRYTGLQVTLYDRGEPIAMNHTSSSTGRGGTAYLGKDILGSVRSVTNESGQLEDRYEYDAFGKPYQGDLDNGMNLGYMGKPYDSNTGVYNYSYRDYKPEAARFTTVDPIRDGSNWFVYVNSDPVNYTDLWGLSASDKNAETYNVHLLTKEIGSVLGIDYHHVYVKITNEEGESYTIRAGTEHQSSSTISDAISDISGSDKAIEGNHGNIHVSFNDQAVAIETRQKDDYAQTFTVNGSYSEAKDALIEYGKKVNEAEIPYLPVSRNSNSFAYDAVELLTGNRPKEPALSPRSQTRLLK